MDLMKMTNYFFPFLLFFIIVFPSMGQNTKSLLDKGDKLYAQEQYEEAIKAYVQARDIAPEDPLVNFKLGMAYLSSETKSMALSYLEKAHSLKPDINPEMDYQLAMAYQNQRQFKKAIEYFENFKKNNKKIKAILDQKIQECIIGDSLYRHPARVVIENIGGTVNSSYHEYGPILSPDGNALIFTSNRPENNTKSRSTLEAFEDIFISRREGGRWTPPTKIPNVNSKLHDAAASISPDGKMLFIYNEMGNGDIFVSQLEQGVWGKPKALNKNINSLYWETSATISADGQRLYFTSDRPGGQGDLDLWYCDMDPKTKDWGKAVNLGKTINTPLAEDSPFLHPDGKTLYFSSDGHPTMGSNDIFKSEWSNGAWQKPVNLGYPINSEDYDGFFNISADGKSGYYSTLREDGQGGTDIYHVQFLEEIKLDATETVASTGPPLQVDVDAYIDPLVKKHIEMKVVSMLKGKVFDEKTSKPMRASMTLVDNATGKTMVRLRSDSLTGDFEIPIPHGGNYGLATEKTGYLFNSINFNVPQFAGYQEIDATIFMVKAEVGSKAVLKNIFFDTGKSDLRPESISELENLRELLTSNPQLKVQINGHTDNVGDAQINKALSLKRATSVISYLVEKGISSARLIAVGYGEERPIVSNDDEAGGREINRRTEIEIIDSNHKG